MRAQIEPDIVSTGTTVSTPEQKYPSLCQRCAGFMDVDIFGDLVHCGVMVEALRDGAPSILNCSYFRRANPL